jgi:hypothetical protein
MKTRKDSAEARRMRAHERAISVGAAAIILAGSMAVWAAGRKGKTVVDASTDGADQTANIENAPAKSDTVHIVIQTVPPRKAQVKWGRKRLGTIPVPRPLVVERPRDSGPLDLVIRASGFLPVHTRAYTFSDSRVAVKLTPPAEKSKLFGYREEPATNPDGGAPATPALPAPPTP